MRRTARGRGWAAQPRAQRDVALSSFGASATLARKASRRAVVNNRAGAVHGRAADTGPARRTLARSRAPLHRVCHHWHVRSRPGDLAWTAMLRRWLCTKHGNNAAASADWRCQRGPRRLHAWAAACGPSVAPGGTAAALGLSAEQMRPRNGAVAKRRLSGGHSPAQPSPPQACSHCARPCIASLLHGLHALQRECLPVRAPRAGVTLCLAACQ